MRLYPPVWVTARSCCESRTRSPATPFAVGAASSPRSSPSTAIHASSPTPTASTPRASPPSAKPAARYAYFPFAGGSRQCIAEGLAWMEGTLILATIARDWRLSLPAGAPATLAINPAISLRPRHGLPIHLDRR